MRHLRAMWQKRFEKSFHIHAIALLEGETEGLAVIGEQQKLMRAQRLPVDRLQHARDGLIELAQCAEGVARPWAGVMRHLVIAAISRID